MKLNKLLNNIKNICEPSMLFDMDELKWNGFQIIDSTNEYAKRCVEICMT